MVLPSCPTRSQVRKAGHIIRQWWVSERIQLLGEDVQRALDVLDAYRAAHQYPLNAASMALRSMINTVHANGVVSQRLKRHFSIITKLEREPRMQLAMMHDIAGCRAVVQRGEDIWGVVGRWNQNKDQTGTKRMQRIYDYIANPKPSGYRGVHVIVKYHGFLVEVQLRTEVQNEWAAAVERVGGRIREDLKGSRGPQEVLDFFGLASQAMALEETGSVVSRDLVQAVREARKRAEPLMKRDTAE